VATAGFLLASKNLVDPWLLLATLSGIGFIIASACVSNNIIDRGIDQKMFRTKKRALVTGLIRPKDAIIYATVLGFIGIIILVSYTNLLTILVGLIGWIDYVIFYSISKRRFAAGTIIGSISGATPPVAGYISVTNQFDLAALLLFIILIFWQMPHFYAIAMYRLKDYSNAGIPVLPIQKGFLATKLSIMLYILAFILACSALTILGYTSYLYQIAILLSGVTWLIVGLRNIKSTDNSLWARNMFFTSLLVLMVFCTALALDAFMH
jgi:heme o synthase